MRAVQTAASMQRVHTAITIWGGLDAVPHMSLLRLSRKRGTRPRSSRSTSTSPIVQWSRDKKHPFSTSLSEQKSLKQNKQTTLFRATKLLEKISLIQTKWETWWSQISHIFFHLKKRGEGNNIFHHFTIIIIIYNARHMIISLTYWLLKIIRRN